MGSNTYRLSTVLLAVLLCASALPQSVAADETTTEHFAFGMEYDWTNMNDDFESMTGLPLDDILADIMQSADDAGIEMVLLEELTGTSSVIIDQYEDGTKMFNPPDGSGSVEVTKHVTELTIRHGDVMDMAMITEWSDARAGWDLTISAGGGSLLNVDAYYVEYRDANGLIYGHDVDMSMATEQSFYFDLQGHLEADDGESVMPLNIHMEMGVDYSVDSAQSEIVYSEASELYQAMSALEGGEDLYWGIGEGEDNYVYWYGMDEADTNCEWSGYEYECSYETGSVDWDTWSDSYFSCNWINDYWVWDCYDSYYGDAYYYNYCEHYNTSGYYACTSDTDNTWEMEYYLYETNYEDGNNPPYANVNTYIDYIPYCEYYDSIGEYHCTYDFGWESDYENSLGWTHYEDGTSPMDDDEIWDEVESHTGAFATTTGFDFELTGLPAEEMGLPEGKWDVSASDTATDAGSFDEDFECEMGMELFEGTQMITTDGDQIEVMQAYTTPLPFGMTCHIANLFVHAFEGTEDAPTLADMIQDSTEDISESMGGESDSYASSDQLSIEAYTSGDEVDVYVESWDLNPDNNYEIFVSMTDSDGITQDARTFDVNDGWDSSWDHDEFYSSEWGEHCITAQLKNQGAGGSAPIDTVSTCIEIPKQPEPSALVESIVNGFSESTLENVMENFGSNLEYRLEGYETDFPYDDGDMFVLWDTTNDMVVGFQMVVSTENSNLWYTLIGPESDSYGDAPSPVSVTYFSGQQAIAQEAEIIDDSTLEDLVDLSQHNDELIEDAIEDSLADNSPEAGGPTEGEGDGTAEGADEESGLLPFISPAFTIAMFAAAGLVASLRSRKDQARIETITSFIS